SGTLCLTTGNCAGSGGVVGGAGTANKLAKFTLTGSEIGDSNITDTGSLISLASAANIGDLTGAEDTLTVLRHADATSGATTQNSSLLTLQGAYWDGAAT